MKTNSVARAYFLPLCGDDGAGDGGRSWPSRSMRANALPREDLPSEGPFGARREGGGDDIADVDICHRQNRGQMETNIGHAGRWNYLCATI